MYNRCRRYNFQPYNSNQVLEDICDDITNDNNENCCHMNHGCMCEHKMCDCCMNNYDCGCGFETEENVFPSNPMLAQSYVPIQTLDKTFTPCCGLKNGTIFPELVSPYEPCQSMEFINYLKARNEIGKGCNG